MGGDRDPVTEVKLGKLGRTRGQHLLKVEKELSRSLWAQNGDSQKPDLVGQSGLTAGTTVAQSVFSEQCSGVGGPLGVSNPRVERGCSRRSLCPSQPGSSGRASPGHKAVYKTQMMSSNFLQT